METASSPIPKSPTLTRAGAWYLVAATLSTGIILFVDWLTRYRSGEVARMLAMTIAPTIIAGTSVIIAIVGAATSSNPAHRHRDVGQLLACITAFVPAMWMMANEAGSVGMFITTGVIGCATVFAALRSDLDESIPLRVIVPTAILQVILITHLFR